MFDEQLRNYRAVIFDYEGVLNAGRFYNWQEIFIKALPFEKRERWRALWQDRNRGKFRTFHDALRAAGIPDPNLRLLKIRATLLAAALSLPPERFRLLDDLLQNNVQWIIASGASCDWATVIMATVPETWHKRVLLSCNIGYIKPEASFYAKAHNKIKEFTGPDLPPGEALYITDTEEDYNGACAYGFSVAKLQIERQTLPERLGEAIRRISSGPPAGWEDRLVGLRSGLLVSRTGRDLQAGLSRDQE